MTKTNKTTMTREELLAQLQAIDDGTEIAKLRADVERLTTENAALLSQRRDLTREVADLQKDMDAIREAVRGIDRRSRRYGAGTAEAAIQEAGDIATRKGWAHVQIGIAKGTHDPKTGLEYNRDTMPIRDLTVGTRPLTKTELGKVFPELDGPTVEITEEAAEEAMTALGIAEA